MQPLLTRKYQEKAMDWDAGLWVETVKANGLAFETLMAGNGERFALLLHGFPEHAISWREQMAALARQGYTVWAPNQRGYGRSSRPSRVADYDIEHLIEDVAGLIDVARARGATRTVLIGHDWGGVVAWCFAARNLRPLDALVILNAPHPMCYVRSMGRAGAVDGALGMRGLSRCHGSRSGWAAAATAEPFRRQFCAPRYIRSGLRRSCWAFCRTRRAIRGSSGP